MREWSCVESREISQYGTSYGASMFVWEKRDLCHYGTFHGASLFLCPVFVWQMIFKLLMQFHWSYCYCYHLLFNWGNDLFPRSFRHWFLVSLPRQICRECISKAIVFLTVKRTLTTRVGVWCLVDESHYFNLSEQFSLYFCAWVNDNNNLTQAFNIFSNN